MSKENDEEEINRVLEFLKNNQDFAYSIQEISKKVGIVEERAEQVIEYLSDYGFIVGRVLDEVTYYMYLEIKVQKFTQDKQMELFGYDCPSGYTGHDPSSCKSCPQRLEEYTVKRITVRALDQLGYKIDHIAWGSSPGADIIVTHSDKNQLILEAKGKVAEIQCGLITFSVCLVNSYNAWMTQRSIMESYYLHTSSL